MSIIFKNFNNIFIDGHTLAGHSESVIAFLHLNVANAVLFFSLY